MRGYLVSFGSTFLFSVALTFIVRFVARRHGFVAKPRADRWHTRPTALLGGVAIYLAFLVTFLIRRPAALAGESILFACATAMFVLGLVDDVVRLKPYSKLVGQIVCASALTLFGLRLNWVPSVTVLDQALTVFWLVGITNALNLLDNLDGAAAGVAAIAAGFLVYFAHVGDNPLLAALVAAFCGAIGGFLVFNRQPASIFMGDCGSLFIGFFLAGVTMVNTLGPTKRNVVAVLFVPVLLLMIPILDTTLVTVSRKLHGRPVSQGGRDHTSHRLVALGFSDRAAAWILWGLAAAGGTVAVLVQSLSWFIGLFLVVVFGLGLLLFLMYVGRVKVYEPVASENEARDRALLPTLADLAYKRRIFEVLCDVVLILLAYSGAFLLRFEGERPEPFYGRFAASLPVVTVTQLGAFLALGLYRGIWRYTSMGDLPTLARAVGGGWLASLVAVVVLFRLEGFSRAVLIGDGVLLLLAIVGSRVAIRFLHTKVARLRTQTEEKGVLIYGAGDGGDLLVRELLSNQRLGLRPVGFIDDDPHKHGRILHGVPVLGSITKLKEFAAERGANELLIATDKLTSESSRVVEEVCRTAGVSARRMRIAFD